jgi:cobalt-zinc-cadmium efflux system outer membrane protein
MRSQGSAVPASSPRPVYFRSERFPVFRRLASTLAALAAWMGGCQSYERKPLDVAATREAWLTRSPGDESAREFAHRLGREEGQLSVAGDEWFDPTDGLTLAEAEPVALVFNRELRVARLEARVARATAENAGRWEDPVAGVDIERIVSSVAEPWVVLGTVGLTIPISGRLDAEKQRAGAEYAAELQRLAAREWAVRAALRELWIEWSSQSLRAELSAELVDLLRGVVDLASRQEQAGVMSRIDARVFRVELAAGEAETISAAARVRELELQIRDLLGLAPSAQVDLVKSVAFVPRAGDPDTIRAALEATNAELAAVRAEYEAAEHALRVEVREQYPDLTIGPGYGTDEGDDRVLLGLQMPIPLWNHNRQGVAEATASREAARGRFESTYEHLGSRLAIACTRYQAGRAMREAVERNVLPLADEQDADVRRVAKLGRVDPLMLLQSIRSRQEAKLQLVNAVAAEAIGAVRLDELIGPPQPHVDPGHADPRTASSDDAPQGARP